MAGGKLRDRRRVEGAGREHRSFRVSADEGAEQLVVGGRVDHRDGEQVHGERQRIDAEPEAVQPDTAGVPLGAHAAGERPAVIVDRRGLAAVIFVRAEQFLGELAEHAAPQVEVVGFVPRGLARRLEDADGHHLDQPARVGDPGGVTVVQREGRRAGYPVMAQRQRADGHGGRAGAQVARVSDRGAQPVLARLTALPGCRVFVRGRAAHVHAVEETAASEGQSGVAPR